MRKNGGASYLGLAVIILLVIAILYVGISALQDQRVYQREAAITPTPSITPRTVRITEDPALPTSTPTPCILQKNSIGIEVKQLQQRLKDLGYYSGDVDGQYGTGTQTAVTAFQAQHGLKADGVAGEQTLAILYSESAQTFVPTPTPSATPAMLSSGSSGDEVKALQSRLQQLGFYSGVLDGDYGKGTRAAVKLFQAQHGLDDDGIAGQKTLEMLYSNDAQPMLVTPTPAAVQVLAGSQPLLVNRQHPVASDFAPADLVNLSEYCDSSLVKIKYDGTQGVREAADALLRMLEAAKADGITNWQVSAAYRSYADQQRIFDNKVKSFQNNNPDWSLSRCRSAASVTVADPGASEHHTGLAFDMTVPNTSMFLGTPQCAWLHEHCWEYGFILRYTDEKQQITGFAGEAWHIRYVGTEHSLAMQQSGQCLEEYLGEVQQ
ncbi:MAG: peptidoglycan-binding protein [Clostridiales bacterium]|nr:peptidoglycan-binding protein [Clostridiales bacterium]MDY5469507.1 peptidoglycan-binding protein [Eubacteriales bacterium]